MKVAFIGLGVMGYPMAAHVLRAGLEICVFNRNAARAEQWCAEYGGDMAPTPAEAAKNADVVLVCVGNDNDVRAVVAAALNVHSDDGEGCHPRVIGDVGLQADGRRSVAVVGQGAVERG